MGDARLHEAQAGPGRQGAVDDTNRAHHAAVLVVVRVEDQRLQRRVGIAGRGGDTIHDRVEQRLHSLAGLGRHAQDALRRQAQHLLDLRRVPIGLGRRQVDLVEHGHDLEVVLESQIAIGQGLGLDTLRRVHQQHHPLAGGQAPAHLIAEVHVPRRVDQVQHVAPPLDSHVLGLDGDTALPLDVHRVEVLLAHVPWVHGPRQLEDPVGERGLAVVDVADDGEVAKAWVLDHCHESSLSGPASGARPPCW